MAGSQKEDGVVGMQIADGLFPGHALLLVCVALAGSSCTEREQSKNRRQNSDLAQGSAPSSTTRKPASDPLKGPSDRRYLRLRADGLTIRHSRGNDEEFTFGGRAAPVFENLSELLGPPKTVETLEECGAGPLTSSDFGFLSLVAQDGKFVGWTLNNRGNANPLSTDADLRIGSMRKELDREYTTQVFESSLGLEFTAGKLSGLLDGAAPTSRITHLWAGTNCIMR